MNRISVLGGPHESQRPLTDKKQVAVVLGGNHGADDGISIRFTDNAAANTHRKSALTDA